MALQPQHVGTYLDRTVKLIKQSYLRVFRENNYDLSTEQWVILDLLHKKEGISQTELANGSFKNAPTVSRIIDLLAEKGYLERHRFENDRRRYSIHLTQQGREVYEGLLPSVQQLREQTWKGLDQRDYEELTRILDQVMDNFLAD